MALLMDLQAIETALVRLIALSAAPEADVFEDKEPLSADVVRRMIGGYAYINELLRAQVNLFSYGSSAHWLELNHLVLCGATPERREQFRNHIAQTERRFYDDSIGGIGERIDWLMRHRSNSPEALAAGIFLHMTSAPQLFIEGNRRTATLVASYALTSRGRPPLVVTENDYKAYFALTDDCKHMHRDRWDHFLSYYGFSYRMERFIRQTADARYLKESDGPEGPATGMASSPCRANPS
ncbi:MAG: hypothetical protein ACOYJQ_15585 [Pseudochelatococcus sp.]|jgi:hypothetical protein|uniref:hypothetical protein n=1 Tax=Pseudochelatococcus sp. TaxID=2020869 RepID=UPI003D8B0EB8